MKPIGKMVLLAGILCLFFLVESAQAGSSGEVTCTTPGCGFHQKLTIGGGKNSPAVTGYCRSTKQFVRQKLNNWSEYHNTHYCPGTKEPMQPIYDGADVAEIPCPKCGNKTLHYERKRFFD